MAVNSLWPRSVIATAAVMYELGGEQMMAGARKPEIMGDAAHAILTQPSRLWTGRFFLDDEVLIAAGVRDFSKYDAKPGEPLITDFFVEMLPGMKEFRH